MTPFVLRRLKRLNQEQRAVLRRRLLHTQDIYPFCKQLLEDWDTYLILLDKGESRKTPLTKKEKQVWETVDKSLPIVLETKLNTLKMEEPEVWFVRILMHKVKGKCVDIRQFKKVSNQYTEYFEPTENGITFQINLIDKIIDAVFKMFRKHKGDNK
jgi:hypothetical protein